MPEENETLPRAALTRLGNLEKLLGQILAPLSEEERVVIGCLLGLRDGKYWKHDRIGRLLKISRTRVREIENQAFGRLFGKSSSLQFLINWGTRRARNDRPFIDDSEVKFFPRVKNLIVDPARTGGRQAPTAERIRELVREGYGVTDEEMQSRCKEGKSPFARHMAMYLMSKDLGWASQKVSASFGRNDHGAALYAIGKIRTLLKKSPKFREDIEKIRSAY